MKKEYILLLAPWVVFFLLKLLRYWSLLREDKRNGSLLDFLVLILRVVLSLLIFPLVLIDIYIESLFGARNLRQADQALRFVHRATKIEMMPKEKQQEEATGSNRDASWNFEAWVKNNLSPLGFDAEEVGFCFARDRTYLDFFDFD